MKPNKIIPFARGEKSADLLLTNARIINVFSGEIFSGDIAVAGGFIVGFGSYPAKKVMDIDSRYIAPGFIDAHVHIESAMTGVTEFVRAVLPHGTTTVVADPHEIANVLGTEGIEFMIRSGRHQPMSVYFTLPSCVPATSMETSGATLLASDLLPYMSHQQVAGLGEMMNYPGVIHEDTEVLTKIEQAKVYRKPVDGHAPALFGRDLYAYVAAGVSSDHECTTIEEASEKLGIGMRVMIREGTVAKNLRTLLPLVNERTFHRMMWCTDDRHPNDLLDNGHIDSIVREAVNCGINPVMAIQMATLNPAEYFGLSTLGAIAPGRQADLVVFSDLDEIKIEQVFQRGILVAQDQTILPEIKKPVSMTLRSCMNVKAHELDFSIPADSERIRVMDLVPGQIVTRQSIMKTAVLNNQVVSDISRDILKIAVVERYTGSGGMGKAFVRGFGLRRGAIASSVAHDSHNIIVVGTNDGDMKAAVDMVCKMKGGMVAACNHQIHARLPLSIAGLMSVDTVEAVRMQLDRLIGVARGFGTTLNDPFMTLSFLALPVIPELKITDKGLIDVLQFKLVSLFAT
jgi:adenine deaminase